MATGAEDGARRTARAAGGAAVTDELGRCEVCPTLTDAEDLVEELRHHAAEVVEAATAQAMRRLRAILDRVDPDAEVQAFLREAALTIIDGHECHPELDAFHGEVCHCRAEGRPHEVGIDETYEALASFVFAARALYDARRGSA
jgi:hypothetical protein